MGCCASSLKLKELSLGNSIYVASSGSRSLKRLYSSRNSSGLGSNSSSGSSSRSIWSRSKTSQHPICDDFAEQPEQLERSCGYYTCSSADSSPRKQPLITQDMERSGSSSDSSNSPSLVGNLQWEMHMMQRAQRIMPKTSSPISQRRGAGELPSSSYHKWRNYLQSTPAHMLHNVTHIPEAIAGHFCPTGFPGYTDLEEMESAAKRFKVDIHMAQEEEEEELEEPLYTTSQLLTGHTHTITTDL
ncbi:hypothetical protein KR059_012306 [Drosophila kikkawai]|nr:hypothetical protein KR059_012306 [Drosophila kikkawai]